MPDRMKVVERNEFVTAVKNDAADGMALRKAFAAEMKAVDLKARTIDFVISTAAVDRVKDSISVSGWQTDNFLKSPVVLWSHDSSIPPIARAISVNKDADALMSTALFMERDLSPFADTIYRMYIERFLSAVSVGFIPIKYSFSAEKGREFGLDFSEQELVEFSCCAVPANPEALIAARAKGIDIAPLREWAEKLLDTDGRVWIPRTLLAETFKLAKTPASTRKKYLPPKAGEKADTSDWKVGASRDLPIDDSESWDGPAAEASIFEHAGGDNFDSTKARGGFLIYDAAAPKLKGSYKLPFAHVVGGELKAVKGGIRAAASRLPQTDASQSALDEARKVIDHYETRMGKTAARFEYRRTLFRDGTTGTTTVVPSEPDPASDGLPPGNCGRTADEECGMKDPMECAMHFNPQMDDPVGSSAAGLARLKAGRRISAENVAKLHQARTHIDDVIQSNDMAAEPDADDHITDPIVDPNVDTRNADPREAARLRLAQLLN